jgi:hypothetical protein
VSLGVAETIAQAASVEFGFLLIVSSIITLGLSWGTYLMLVRKRALQDTPTALIRSAPQGYIELRGHAEMMAGELIYAPLSLKPCIWFSYKVAKKHRNTGRNNVSSEWRTIDSGISGGLFFLVDTTGRCVVDPDGAKVTPSSNDTWYGNERTPGRITSSSNWLRCSGLAQFGMSYRYTERRIDPGVPLYALGDFTTHRGAGVEFDRGAEVRDLLLKWKENNNALLERFDADNDGEINLQEWDAARHAAEVEVDSKHVEVAAAPRVDVLGRTKRSRNPFIIAAKTEAEMLSRFHYSGLGLGILALVTSVAGLWIISVR